MFKYFIVISFLLFADFAMAKAHKKHKRKKHLNSTVYSMCSRDLVGSNKTAQTIIVAMETLNESSCKELGKKKAEQYVSVGWKCVGKNNEDLFSCESEKSASYAYYNGVKLDHLTFTNLLRHRSLVAYLNPGSNKTCHEDRDELISAGVKDAVCHRHDL